METAHLDFVDSATETLCPPNVLADPFIPGKILHNLWDGSLLRLHGFGHSGGLFRWSGWWPSILRLVY